MDSRFLAREAMVTGDGAFSGGAWSLGSSGLGLGTLVAGGGMVVWMRLLLALPSPGYVRGRAGGLGSALAALLAVWLMMPGCGYSSIQSAQRAMRAGSPGAARAELEPMAESGFGGPHEVLGWLEFGSALHETGSYRSSNRAFLEAENAFDAQDRRPRTSISVEIAAAGSNPLTVAYRGSANERVLSPTYRAVNHLLLGEPELARNALNEAGIRQEQALQLRAARVEEAKAARRGRTASGIDVDRSAAAAAASPAVAARMASLERYRPYRDFVNPFTELLHGVFRLAAAEGPADAERAVALLRSVAGMVPGNTAVAETLASAERALGGEIETGVTHVFFATGFAPRREAVRIDLPLVLVNDAVDYVGVSFPQLVFDDGNDRSIVVEGRGGSSETEVVADMDRMVAVEFREEFPTLLTRAIIGAAAKVAASYAVNVSTDEDETVNVLARILAGLYLLSQNQADTRAWVSVPKQFQYARVRTPADGVVRIRAPGSAPAEVKVDPGGMAMVFVRSLRPGIPLRVEPVVFSSAGPVAERAGERGVHREEQEEVSR